MALIKKKKKKVALIKIELLGRGIRGREGEKVQRGEVI